MPTNAPKYGIGSTISSDSATIALASAEDASGIQWNDTYYKQGSGFDSYITKTPADGNKYFVMTATVTNIGTESMDLTCSLPVVINVLSASDQRFDPIGDLYNVQGNPECNNFMQPESSEPMTWVFEVPASSHIIGAYFHDLFASEAEAAIFTFDDAYEIGAQS